ncbi:MAG TPA: hypothetical protein VFJ91_06475, partial [Gaiellaceae bacterium]|nr:hypothetical protein [Gaiellaceae bacterium]
GEPQVGDEGYLGLDVVRAARIASAGTGGQILISETTRALLGNTLPDGVAVVDLGKQQLKDIQHEHIYELSVDGTARGYQAPANASRESRADDIGARFEQRVERYVEDQLERAFSGEDLRVPTRLAIGGVGIAAATLVVFAAVVFAIILLAKLAF